MTASYPDSVWTGGSRDRQIVASDRQAPNYIDWNRIVAEMQAVQTRLGLNANDGTENDAVGLQTETTVGVTRRTLFSLTGVEVDITDSTKEYGSFKLFDLPSSGIVILGSHLILEVTAGSGLELDSDGDLSIGIAVSNGSPLIQERAAIHARATIPTMVAGVATVESYDGHKDLFDANCGGYLNFLFDGGSATGNTTISVTGALTIVWIPLNGL